MQSSTCGSELVASQIATDETVKMCYTLQMLVGIALYVSIVMLGDNKTVMLRTTTIVRTNRNK